MAKRRGHKKLTVKGAHLGKMHHKGKKGHKKHGGKKK